MPTKKLTDLFVERVKPPARGRIEYFDASWPGLALRVTEKGAKSWSAFYRFKGRLRRLTIGRYPAIKPAQARREAAAALDRLRQGFDPAEEKRARRGLASPDADTFGAVAHDYLERHVAKNCAASTYREIKRNLEHDVMPKWRDRPIASIGRRDVIDLIDGIIDRGAEVQANRTLARLTALFNWGVGKGRVATSPAAAMRPPTKESTRDRVLSDDEICWLWEASSEIGWPFGPLFKLLLLTAQRRDEVARMAWSEVDLEKAVWIIPSSRAKNNREHQVQLSDAAIKILQSLPRPEGEEGLVFTRSGRNPVTTGFPYAKRRLDALMTQGHSVPAWRLHDLRRTATTGMARMNFPPHVVDKILNHVSGTIRGVAAVYNRFEYLEERRAALNAWGQFIEQLVAPSSGSNVIALWT